MADGLGVYDPVPGDAVTDLDTPTVLVDLDILERNIDRVVDLGREHGVDVRFHAKAHKIPELSERQVAMSGNGILCQKLGTAEVMVDHGIEDVLLVCPVVTPRKITRLVRLTQIANELSCLVDCRQHVDAIAEVASVRDETVDIVIEVEAGAKRTGVQHGAETADLAKHVSETDGVSFAGLLAYDSHIKYEADTDEEKHRLANDLGDKLERTVELCENRGVDVAVVGSGATATAEFVASQSVVTEIHPGRFAFNDTRVMELRPDVSLADCAVTVAATVISKPSSDRVILDVGAQTISFAQAPNPICRRHPKTTFYRWSSEHGFLDVSETETEFSIGNQVEVVVHNLYGTMNLQNQVVGVRDMEVKEVWDVSARGKSR